MIREGSSKVQITVTNVKNLPYPCLLEYANEHVDFVILAYGYSDYGCIKGIIVKLIRSDDPAIRLGLHNKKFSFKDFGTSAGFNFYNGSVEISNLQKYTVSQK